MHTMQSSTWIATARLLRRSGFGATGTKIDAAVKAGYRATVEKILAPTPVTDAGAAATPVPALPEVPQPASDDDSRKKYFAALSAQIDSLPQWWVRRMVAVDEPFIEKITFCWHNHFATSALKVRSAVWLRKQNETLRALNRGDFGALASAMLTDAAMLFWLDGESNTVAGANENLSREFMELFTLGHGDGYTEADVRQGARALTGWRIDKDGRTFLDEKQHDQTSKTVLGVTGNLDQAGFARAVLAKPVSARFVATRLYGQLVSDVPPTAAVIDRLTAAYGPGRDLTALYRAMFTDPSFTAAAGTSVASPLDWVIGVVRALAIPVPNDKAADVLVYYLRALGQWPFYPNDVSGWPSGQAWLSTASADLRIEFATALVAQADLSFVTDTPVKDRLETIAYRLGIGAWSDRSYAALQPSLTDPRHCLALAVNTPEYLVH